MVGHLKGGAVKHDVAHDDLDTLALQAAHQQPQALHDQLGVSLALDVDVAPQAAVLHRALQIDRGVPHIGGAQLLQRGVSGHQLHHRCRVHRQLRTVRQARRRSLAALGIHHHHRQGLAR